MHGVPGPPEAPDARDWPLYRGYGALLAEAGVLDAVPRLTVASPDDLYAVAARVAATSTPSAPAHRPDRVDHGVSGDMSGTEHPPTS
ncbi:hypothetical protein ACFFKH_23110 [Micromonospora marina]|uniref:Uncharacterized protein n=1 Tax=Micromonospora marina TaxID=307120 RepID=A0A1C4ZGK5_9ACTN|nr:hypothetical protein [Micromonospora marina]SCF31966.1 hypothetical protein GA0070215_11768 [Micromonospora marina]